MAFVDATFAGVHADASAGDASFTLGLGPAPSSGQVCLAGVGHSMSSGDLVFSDGNGGSVTIANLTVAERTEHDGPDGQFTRIMLKDRRWRWEKQSHVTGEWNKPGADGITIPAALRRSARQLVAMCLAAMGETGYDVTALPDNFYPYVKWEFAPAAQAAQGVCDQCRCVLTLASDDTAKVVALGSGATPPATGREQEETGVRYTDQPDTYIVRGGRAMIQRTSRLVPVGLDTDGAVKPLASLSYYSQAASAYGGSFIKAINGGFYALKETAPEVFKAAEQSCGLWFRLPDAERVYLPVLSSICETATEDGAPTWRRPYCLSDALYLKRPDGMFEAQGSGEVGASWDLDAERGIVKMKEPPWADAGGAALAAIDLVWASESRQDDGSVKDEDYYTYVSGTGPAERVECAEWLVLRGVVVEGEPDWINKSELDAVAAQLVALIQETGETETSGDIELAGIVNIWPDGAIRQVTWSAGERGASTKLTHNTDRPPIGRAKLGQQIEALKKQAEATAGAAAAAKASLVRVTLPAVAAEPPKKTQSLRLASSMAQVVNVDLTEAPDGGVGWIVYEEVASDPYIKRAEYPGVTALVICHGAIPSGKPGVARVTGRHRVLVDDWEHISMGDRLGALPHSWHARRSMLGPMLVVAKMPKPYVLAEITRRRGDGQLVTNVSGSVSGSFETIRFGPGWRVRFSDKPGVLLVDPVPPEED